MTIARIEIDFAIRDEDDLVNLMTEIGDFILPLLDPHDADGNCSRWVSVSAYGDVSDEYDLGFDPDAEDVIPDKLGDSLEAFPHEFRANSEWN